MLRVLQVIGKMDRAGAETFIMNLYREIDVSKVQFDFMVFTDEKGDYDDEIEQRGGHIYHMPSFKGYNYISLYKKFDAFFNEHPYKVVHGHIGSLAPAYLKSAKKYGAYAIAHSHNTDSNIFFENLTFNLLAHPVRKIADYFFGCSQEAGEDRFGKSIANSGLFKVINNGIDTSEFVYTSERHLALKTEFGFEDKVIYGHVGRFASQKNHPFLIDVFNEIQKKQENAILILIGRGEEEEQIKNKVRNLKLDKKVYFFGIRSDIPDMMNLMDAFIFPSNYEGLGVVGIEAQAAGLPCFFSTGIAKEATITDQVFIYDIMDGPEMWADRILKVMSAFKREDSQQKIIDAKFDISFVAKELQDFYMEHSK